MRALLVVAVLLWLAAPASASAAFRPTPASAPTVAGPLADGARLVAFDRGGQLCLDVVRDGEDKTYPDCGSSVPETPFEVRPGVEFGPRPTWHYGVVPAAVAAVEIELSDGGRVRVPTEPGDAYHGAVAPAEARFFLAVTPGNDIARLTRAFAADGTLLGVSESPFAARTPGDGPPPGARRIAGGRGFGVFAHRQRRLAPTPLEPERYDAHRCVTTRTADMGNGEVCTVGARGLQGKAVLIGHGSSCSATAVAGLAAPGVRRVVLVLGDGSRRSLRTHASSPLGRWRGFGARLGAATAVRRYVALGRDGRGLAAGPVRNGPAQGPCSPPRAGAGFATDVGYFSFAVVDGDPRRSRVPGAGPLVAYDRGDELCVGPGGVDPALDCALPPVEKLGTRISGAHRGGRTLLAGVVAPSVTGVELTLDGGERLTLPAAPDPAYAGRYAGLVGFVSASLPGRRFVLNARLLGADRPLHWHVPGLDPPPRRTTPIGDGVTASVVEAVGGDRVCVRFRGSGSCASRGIFTVRVSCGAAGGIHAGGLLGSRTRRVVAILRDGRRVHAAIVRPPASFPRRPRAWLLRLGPDVALERIVAVGGDGAAWQRLPAAREQCGYGVYGFFGLSGSTFGGR